MLKRNLTAVAVAALLASAAFSANAMPSAMSGDVAREAAEGPRGEGKGHPLADVKDVIAREAGEGPRGEGKGHPLTEIKDVIAREAGEGPRGEGKGHPLTEIKDVIAREASEGPRGADNERPGDRQRRGGRLS